MSTDLIAELNAIRDDAGELTPRVVVDVAADPNHPLHSRFEWDDAIAGDKYRLEQARHLLRVTYQPDPAKPSHLRAYVAVKGETSPQSEYIPTTEALADPFTRELLLRQMKRDWKTFERRYRDMAEFGAFVASQLQGATA